MVISAQEAKILARTELNADLSIPDLEQATGLRAHTIRYALQKLENKQIIRKVPFVDMYPLGYQDFGLYFSLAALQSKEKQEFLNTLSRSPLITFLLELGGDYQYCVGMYARHVSEFIELLDKLSEISSHLFFDKSFTVRVSMSRFQRKYLDPTAAVQELSFGNTRHPEIIDALDEKILLALTQHGEDSQRDLSRRLGIPFSTINQRLQILTHKKIFYGMTYAIDSTKIGLQSFQILIYAKGLSHAFQNNLYAYAKQHPAVVYFVRCIGSWDFEIGIDVENAKMVTLFTQQLCEKMGSDILGFKVLPIFSVLKYAFFRPSTT